MLAGSMARLKVARSAVVGLMPVLPHHLYTPQTFDKTTLRAPIGSGPYVIDKVDPGKRITYKRDPNYWGRDLPVNRGRYNIDEIRFDYYRDAGAMFEAFKSGLVTFRDEDDLAIIIAVTDTGQAVVQHALLKHHRLQIAHKDCPVREQGMELCEQRLIFRQDWANRHFGIIFSCPGTDVLNGVGTDRQLR